ncbi:MAG: GatB/YqeY domain-containing protein [Candidatus Paceibacterota bacterium]
MSLHQQIKDQMKEAMLNKDAVRLSVIRALVSGFMNELVAKGKKPQEELSDEDALMIIKRQTKQHKDSIDQFKKGGREDLVESEEAELKVLESYLPEMLGEEEIKKVVEAKKTELGVTDKSKLGIFMGAVMKEFKGKADGALVKKIVEESF